ncbi:MAG: DUF4440 domain-containing protein [Pseudomonadota bacterium]
MLTALALTLAQPAEAAPELPAPILSLEEATAQIQTIDTAMFWYAFEGCDAAKVRGVITDDFRMVHDLSGLVANSGDAFAGMLSEQCAAREAGGANEGYKNRRLLVPGSESFTPLGEWGVLHRGWHTFQELRQRPPGAYGEGDPGGPTWVTTGGGRFLNIYQWMPEEGRFRMQKTLSLDHGAARSVRPAQD